MVDRKYNILVTGVGAIIGYGIIKSLRSSGISANIVGMDIYDDAVGQAWCDKFIQAKYAKDPLYLDFLKGIIDEHQIDLVFFGTEQEIYRVGLSGDEFKGYRNKFVLNKKELLILSQDKWKTYQFLLEHGGTQFAIPSRIEGEYDELAKKFGVPFMLKPRSSYASKGINVVKNKEEFDFYKVRMRGNFMAQPVIGDSEHEYTVGVFGLGDGTYSGMIAMRRKLSQEGATAKAEVVLDTKLENTVQALVSVFKPNGPTNLQFRYHEGRYLLLEINPRISSSTSMRMALGYNEAEMCIRYYLESQIMVPQISKGKAIRYIDEVVVIS
ncbi:ATP-grasp domain-containing protein [Qiania dongpingensis]|uniref:ATP-grasp domain-containing protein n=1 Tax=Qiania dongpingensis TaxID=2763669 RepID=A0A7G9G7S1_9FIRM|nr:ATP-grasp domain-containing protein [Qiania dongpingensis]QNM06853.1 ATP-grasp domain-containing protein [Qiania dongpingensis]